MYRVNPLLRNVLITNDEVIFHAPTKHTLDVRMVQNSIIVAEERILRPALGVELYTALIDQKNKEVTDLNKDELETQINDSLPEGAADITLTVGDIVNSRNYLSAENLSLWKQHLWKLTAECVITAAFPEGYVQFASEGAVHTTPQAGPMTNATITSPELRSMKWMMDKKNMDRIDPLREAMHQWLCLKKKADSSLYVLYTKFCDCDVDGVAYKRKTDIVLGLYDEEDNKNCCR